MAGLAADLPRARMPATALRLMGDDRLSRLAAAGDSRAFEVIYERHHQALYRYCYSILGNREDAADALQSTMASAVRALVGEEREIAIKPWLFRVAHNECVSMLRKRRPTAVIDTALELEAPSHDPGLRERLRELVADMQELPAAQRGALVMRELSGLGYREVAAALDTSEPHARQLVYEARAALHELAEGRSMECESVRRSISDADGRVLRARRIRSHLRSCDGCRTFDHLTRQRRRDLAAFAPPIPVALAAAVLHKALGGGSGAATVAASSGGGTGLGSVVAGKTVLASAVAKVAVVAVAAAAVGTGAAEVVHKSARNAPRQPIPTVANPASSAANAPHTGAPVPAAVPPANPRPTTVRHSHRNDPHDAPPPVHKHPRHTTGQSGSQAPAVTPHPSHSKPVTPKPEKPKKDPPGQTKQKSSNGHPAKPAPKPDKTKPTTPEKAPAVTTPAPPPQSQNGQQNDQSGKSAEPHGPAQENGNPHG
jgi:RNA polymerase sigma factor (sigma-70 family)